MASDNLNIKEDGFNIGIGVSVKKNCQEAAKEATQCAWAHIKEGNVDLAIVFTTPQFACYDTLATLNHLLGDVPLVGCSSSAILWPQGFLTHGLAIMLLNFPKGIYFNVSPLSTTMSSKTPQNVGEELGEKLLYGFNGVHRDLGMIFIDRVAADTHQFIPGLQERLGASFPLLGICPSDNFQITRPFLYCNQTLFQDAVCGIVFGGKLEFGMGTQHGWKPLGKPRLVTKSLGNMVFEIDGMPAVEIYKHYFARDLAALQKEIKTIAIYYPLGIYLEEEKKYLLRTIVAIQDSGALVFQGNIPEKSQIRFMIAAQESCLEATRDAVEETIEGLRGRPPKFVLAFESISRYMLLGRARRKELEIIKRGFGKNTPCIGICTNAELAPLKSLNFKGKTHFHNNTVTFLAFGA